MFALKRIFTIAFFHLIAIVKLAFSIRYLPKYSDLMKILFEVIVQKKFLPGATYNYNRRKNTNIRVS